eukprot:SAG31_NODE_4869_length_2877_cov_1.648446_2_plen_49_part_00
MVLIGDLPIFGAAHDRQRRPQRAESVQRRGMVFLYKNLLRYGTKVNLN